MSCYLEGANPLNRVNMIFIDRKWLYLFEWLWNDACIYMHPNIGDTLNCIVGLCAFTGSNRIRFRLHEEIIAEWMVPTYVIHYLSYVVFTVENLIRSIFIWISILMSFPRGGNKYRLYAHQNAEYVSHEKKNGIWWDHGFLLSFDSRTHEKKNGIWWDHGYLFCFASRT